MVSETIQLGLRNPSKLLGEAPEPIPSPPPGPDPTALAPMDNPLPPSPMSPAPPPSMEPPASMSSDEPGMGGDEPKGDTTGSPLAEPTEPADPIDGMVKAAQGLVAQTQDPELIFKSLKGQVQAGFEKPEHALGLVKALVDTKNLVLQSVAQRLWLFLKTSPLS